MANLIENVQWIHQKDSDVFIEWVKKQNEEPDDEIFNNINKEIIKDSLTTIKLLEMSIKNDNSDIDKLLIRYKKYKSEEIDIIKSNFINSILTDQKYYIVFAFPYNYNPNNCFYELGNSCFTVIVKQREVNEKNKDIIYDIVKYVYVAEDEKSIYNIQTMVGKNNMMIIDEYGMGNMSYNIEKHDFIDFFQDKQAIENIYYFINKTEQTKK
jgi:hypothetical protein